MQWTQQQQHHQLPYSMEEMNVFLVHFPLTGPKTERCKCRGKLHKDNELKQTIQRLKFIRCHQLLLLLLWLCLGTRGGPKNDFNLISTPKITRLFMEPFSVSFRFHQRETSVAAADAI